MQEIPSLLWDAKVMQKFWRWVLLEHH